MATRQQTNGTISEPLQTEPKRKARSEQIRDLAKPKAAKSPRTASSKAKPLPHSAAVEALCEFLDIIAQLRNPDGGCPWDLEQTHDSLKPYVIEEAYEVVDAINHKPATLSDELGDLLLQVALHAQIASEAGTFDMQSIARGISAKMIRRHPHVFGETVAKDSRQVLENWETIKQRELVGEASILDGIPLSMPALLKAQRIGDKVSRVGFDWVDRHGVLNKVREELAEFTTACAHGEPSAIEDEFGDVLFTLAQLARSMKLNSEDLLNRANTKFTRRFKALEKRAAGSLRSLSPERREQLWEQVKSEEPAGSPLPKYGIDFEFHAPHAQSVVLVGDFNSWSHSETKLDRDDNGVWRKRLDLVAGRYEYRYLVDGSWQNDQRPVECVANSAGSWNCVVRVGV